MTRFEIGAFKIEGSSLIATCVRPFAHRALLHLEAVHLDGQFGGAIQAGDVHEAPAFELGAIAEVGIFGEGIVLPAARVIDHGLAQNAGRAVEVEEVAGARTRSMLQDEMAVQQHRLDFGEEVVIAVEIAPAGLHHADLGVGEVVNGAHQKIGGRNKIGIEDGDEFAGGGFQAFLEGSGFIAVAIAAVQIVDGVAEGAIAFHQGFGEGGGIVGGIVQHLDLQELLRIIHLDGLFDQPLHHVALVVQRQLYGDAGEGIEAACGFPGSVLLMLEIRANDIVPMQAVDRENGQHGEVGNQHRPIEPGQLVNSGKGIVQEALNQAVGLRSGNQQRQR